MQKMKVERLTVGQLATNCWLYQLGEKEAAVIDPGDEADVIISALKKLDLFPSYILLTHGHFDHIAAVPELAALECKPKIAIHRLDSQYLGKDCYAAHSISIKAAMGDASFIDAFLPAGKRELPEPDILLEEGDTVGPLTVMHLPGHTQGSAAFWNKDEGIIFSGDTLFKSGYGRTDLPGGNEIDISKSLRRLFKMDGNIRICPGHGGTTTISRETSL